MTIAEVMTASTASISLISLVISLWAAHRAYRLSAQQLLLANRNEFHKLLIEVNRELIRDPKLWAFYDDHPLAATLADDPIMAAKLNAFAYMQMNIFEMVFMFFHSTGDVASADKEMWNAWESYFHNSLKRSSTVKHLLERPDLSEYYPAKFVKYIRSNLLIKREEN